MVIYVSIIVTACAIIALLAFFLHVTIGENRKLEKDFTRINADLRIKNTHTILLKKKSSILKEDNKYLRREVHSLKSEVGTSESTPRTVNGMRAELGLPSLSLDAEVEGDVNMTEKVPVSEEVGNAIEDAKESFTLGAFNNFLNSDSGFRSKHCDILRREFLPYDKDVLIQAIHYGYTIIEPQYKEGDWVVAHDTTLQLGRKMAGDMFVVYGDGRVHKTDIVRYALEYEIKQEKDTMFWNKHNRKPWELKRGDLLIGIRHPLTGVDTQVEDVSEHGYLLSSKRGSRFITAEVVLKEEYRVSCFVEDRLDAKY